MKDFNWNFVLAIVASLATMMAVVMALEFFSHQIYEPPVALNLKDKAALKEFMATAPIISLILIPIAWILGAFAGSFVGGSICKVKKRQLFFIVATFTLLAGLSQLLAFPHPWYFWVLAAFIFPAALLGSRIVKV